MTDPVLAPLSRADTLKLKAAIYNLVDSVKACSGSDLVELHKAGMLPEGCLQYILAVRNGRGEA